MQLRLGALSALWQCLGIKPLWVPLTRLQEPFWFEDIYGLNTINSELLEPHSWLISIIDWKSPMKINKHEKLTHMCLVVFWPSKLTKNLIFATDTNVNKPLVWMPKLCSTISFLFTHIEINLLLKTMSLFKYEWHLKGH